MIAVRGRGVARRDALGAAVDPLVPLVCPALIMDMELLVIKAKIEE